MYLIFLSIFRLRDLFQSPFEKAVSFPFSISSIAQFDVASVERFYDPGKRNTTVWYRRRRELNSGMEVELKQEEEERREATV